MDNPIRIAAYRVKKQGEQFEELQQLMKTFGASIWKGDIKFRWLPSAPNAPYGRWDVYTEGY